MLTIDLKNVLTQGAKEGFCGLESRLSRAHDTLVQGTGQGGEFTGWLDLPGQMLQSGEYRRILAAAQRISTAGSVLVVIGTGGSGMAARAAIELLGTSGPVRVIFTGDQLSSQGLSSLLDKLKNKDFSVNIISKSGSTLEPAISFRVLRQALTERYGESGAAARIYVTTDPENGALRALSSAQGYETFSIPPSVGGRYSAFTAAALLPMAAAGLDIGAFLSGGVGAAESLRRQDMSNPAWQYAAAREMLYTAGRKIELLACYRPRSVSFGRWWTQLFAESEGKNGRGIFPAYASFPADLHSLGQYIQQGEALIFETVPVFAPGLGTVTVPHWQRNPDGLDYLSGRDLDSIEELTRQGTLLAHADGGVPNMLIRTGQACEKTLGELMYFFMFSCGISGYMAGINPFDQPGVEAYKRNVFALLGKPGTEQLREKLRQRI